MAERKVFVIPEGTEVITHDLFDLDAKDRTFEEVVIPESVKRIDVAAFADCESLLKVIVPYGTFGSIGLNKGVDIKKISTMMGHSSVITTEKNLRKVLSRDIT